MEVVIKLFYVVLLFDEIEKVYFEVFNLLLQVMDYGILIDNNGCKVDFCNVILVMIINVGVDFVSRVLIGFIQ